MHLLIELTDDYNYEMKQKKIHTIRNLMKNSNILIDEISETYILS